MTNGLGYERFATIGSSMRGYYDFEHFEIPPARGGHFAALEEPQLLAEETREFSPPLRAATR